jgi:hypothetical protein
MTAQPKNNNDSENCEQKQQLHATQTQQAASSKQQTASATITCKDLVASDTMPKRNDQCFRSMYISQCVFMPSLAAIVYFGLHVTHERYVHGCLSC